MTVLELGAWRLLTGTPHDGFEHMFARFERQPVRLKLPILKQSAMGSPGNHVTVKEQGETSVARYVYLKRFSTFRTERTAVFDEQPAAFVTRRRMRNPGGALNVIANRKTGIAARV